MTRFISNLAPWLAPLPLAYAVGMTLYTGLGWPLAVALLAAGIIETLSLATSSTALELYAYNRGKRKSDPGAPAWLAWSLTAAGLLSQSALILALEAAPVLLLFQVFSAAAVINLAMRADHTARLAQIVADKAQASADRAQRAADKAQAAAAPVQVWKYVCVACGKGYDKQQQLAAHMRSHVRAETNGHKGTEKGMIL